MKIAIIQGQVGEWSEAPGSKFKPSINMISLPRSLKAPQNQASHPWISRLSADMGQLTINQLIFTH